jgi:hypothetical protein
VRQIRGATGRRKVAAITSRARQRFVNHAKAWWYFALPGIGLRGYDFPGARRGQAGGVKSLMFTGNVMR